MPVFQSLSKNVADALGMPGEPRSFFQSLSIQNHIV